MGSCHNTIDNLVVPAMTYGAEEWFPFTEQKITDDLTTHTFFEDCLTNKFPHEDIHMTLFFRYTSGVHRKAMRTPVLAEVGRFPISLKTVCQIITFWTDITESNNHFYLKQTYATMVHQQSII